ncbi:MAG: D-hexose-6-phosphate mutarotase [Opitutaceae bacterium]|nr:D-hexose-6-phosphate mutarotase [Opitutaceae bacterium]
MSSSVRTVTRDQLPAIEIDGAHARVVATPHGAHLVDWQPHDARPVLFLSPRSHFVPDKAIRGGVPLCFPWFGPKADDPKAPQHGFARTRSWKLARADVAPDGGARIEFALNSDTTTLAAWQHAFAARLAIRAGAELELALTVLNSGATPLTFSAALHTYLAVSDVREIAIRGLEHTDYLDKTGGGSVRRREGAEPLRFSGEVDRVYLDTTATCVVDDPGWRRRIHVAKSGSRSTVIWNPWTDKARAMADLGEDAWPGFVCVETCNAADDTVTLAPGATHALAATIHIDQD